MKIYNNENPKVYLEVCMDSKSYEARSITLEVGRETLGIGAELSRSKAVELLHILAHIRKQKDPSSHTFWPDEEDDFYPPFCIKVTNYQGAPRYALSIALLDGDERQFTCLTEAQADLLAEELKNLIDQMPTRTEKTETIDAQRGEVIALGVTDFDPGGNNPLTLDLIFGNTQRFDYTVSLNKRQTKDLVSKLLKLIDQMGD